MIAVVFDRHGGPDVMGLREMPDPEPGPGRSGSGSPAAA